MYSCNIACAQKQYKIVVTFHFKIVNKKNLYINLNDGKTSIDIPDSLKEDSLSLSGLFFGKYASVSIGYHPQKDSTFLKSFFIENNVSRIDIRFDTLKKQYRFNTIRVIDQDEVGGMALKQFAESENDALKAFVDANNGYVPGSVLNAKKIEALDSNIGAKELLFVSKHPNLYFSLALFKNVIIPHREIQGVSIDSLRRFYDTYFSKKYANTYEDSYIRNMFYNMLLSAGNILPEFIEKDINNKVIDLRKVKSKYILLDFWAGWCAPCVKEIAVLNNIREKYPANFLEFVYVSQDASQTAEKIASLKYKNMYGLHFMCDNELRTQFNANAIPKIYLVDRENGKILYSNNDTNIVDEILSKRFAESK